MKNESLIVHVMYVYYSTTGTCTLTCMINRTYVVCMCVVHTYICMYYVRTTHMYAICTCEASCVPCMYVYTGTLLHFKKPRQHFKQLLVLLVFFSSWVRHFVQQMFIQFFSYF